MINLLNRLTWLLSFVLGFIFLFFIGIITDLLDNRSAFDDGTFLVWLLLSGFFGIIIKHIFFSKAFINKCLSDKNIGTTGLENTTDEEDTEAKRQDLDKSLGLEGLPESQDSFSALNSEDDNSLQNENAKNTITSKEPLEVSENKSEKTEELSVEMLGAAEKAINYKQEGAEKESEENKKPSEPGIIQKFFAENALAKIGGILLFLGVLFLLQLVYTVIGPVGKLMVGFAIGVITFGIGVFLDGRGYKKEARIVIGVSILINYLVILSGRYLIEESSQMGRTILNEGITFLFLIINTIFAIIASIAYRSPALLFFAFVVSYLNPFLIGSKAVDTPYTLLGYGILVSLGALFMSYYYRSRSKIQALSLIHIAFVGGGILSLVAPFTASSEWIINLAVLALLSFLSIIFLYKQKHYHVLPFYFGGVYTFFYILLYIGGVSLGEGFKSLAVFFSYTLFTFATLLTSVFLFAVSGITSIFFLFFAPLLIFLLLIITGTADTNSAVWLLSLSAISYVGIFAYTSSKISSTLSYLFFGVLGAFIVVLNGFLGNISRGFSFAEIEFIHVVGIIIATYIFYISAFYFSTKKNLESLYSLGTILGIFMVLPVISREGEFRAISIIGIAGLVVLNIALPLINKRLLRSDIQNLIFGVVVGAIFASYEIYYFMFGESGDSPMTIGLMFLALALVYFLLSFLVFNMLKSKDIDRRPDPNVFYTFVASSISIFSLAVAFIFSENAQVVAIVWLFESSILYFFYQRTKNKKLYGFAFALMAIGIIKIINFVFNLGTSDFYSLVAASFILASFALSLYFLKKEEGRLRMPHDFAHIGGILLIALMIVNIVPSSIGYAVFSTSLFCALLFVLYGNIFSANAKYVLLFLLLVTMGAQIFELNSTFRFLDRYDMGIYKILQYLATIIFIFGLFAFNVLVKENKDRLKINNDFLRSINITSYFYLFIITTQYVYHLFDKNVFVISIYWGIIAFVLLNFGIQKDRIKFRTLGLYVLSLAVIKIVANDIWSGLDNAVMRVIALMFVGGVLISVSLLYSKKYGDHLKGEFSLDNILKDENTTGHMISEETLEDTPKQD